MHLKEQFRSTVLRPVDEDAEPSESQTGSFLPPRLAHLKGPLPANPAAQVKDDADKKEGKPCGADEAPAIEIAAASASAARRQPMMRGSAGRLLMGPWNGQFARAASGSLDTDADADQPVTPPAALENNAVPTFDRRRPNDDEEKEEDDEVDDERYARMEDCRDELSDQAFTGPDEMELDELGPLREQMLEDALTGRATAHHAVTQAASGAAGGGGSRSASGVVRRRTASAPAAVTRRVGAARVASRKRTPMTVKRATQERLANMRQETSAGAGGRAGGLKAGKCTASNVARNKGPRNTMGMRYMQPRTTGLM